MTREKHVSFLIEPTESTGKIKESLIETTKMYAKITVVAYEDITVSYGRLSASTSRKILAGDTLHLRATSIIDNLEKDEK